MRESGVPPTRPVARDRRHSSGDPVRHHSAIRPKSTLQNTISATSCAEPSGPGIRVPTRSMTDRYLADVLALGAFRGRRHRSDSTAAASGWNRPQWSSCGGLHAKRPPRGRAGRARTEGAHCPQRNGPARAHRTSSAAATQSCPPPRTTTQPDLVVEHGESGTIACSHVGDRQSRTSPYPTSSGENCVRSRLITPGSTSSAVPVPSAVNNPHARTPPGSSSVTGDPHRATTRSTAHYASINPRIPGEFTTRGHAPTFERTRAAKRLRSRTRWTARGPPQRYFRKIQASCQ